MADRPHITATFRTPIAPRHRRDPGPDRRLAAETFLPQLPTGSLVVLAGRNPPAPAWHTEPDRAELAHTAVLGNPRPEERRTYLAGRVIRNDRHGTVLTFTHGHPPGLALVADAIGQRDRLGAFDPGGTPDVVRTLFEPAPT